MTSDNASATTHTEGLGGAAPQGGGPRSRPEQAAWRERDAGSRDSRCKGPGAARRLQGRAGKFSYRAWKARRRPGEPCEMQGLSKGGHHDNTCFTDGETEAHRRRGARSRVPCNNSRERLDSSQELLSAGGAGLRAAATPRTLAAGGQGRTLPCLPPPRPTASLQATGRGMYPACRALPRPPGGPTTAPGTDMCCQRVGDSPINRAEARGTERSAPQIRPPRPPPF